MHVLAFLGSILLWLFLATLAFSALRYVLRTAITQALLESQAQLRTSADAQDTLVAMQIKLINERLDALTDGTLNGKPKRTR